MVWIFWLLGCGTTCEVTGSIDYGRAESWICRPGQSTHCLDSLPTRTVETDGSVSSRSIEAMEQPPVACFVVYPTLDLRIGAGLHHDITDVPAPEEWTRTRAGPLRQVCDLYVPIYRQVLIGTYAGKENKKKTQCFDSAYADVLGAFEQFLIDEPERPFVLFGHSQGGQHLSRLMAERIETDPAVLERLLVAYPLGWPVGTDGSRTGGSWQTIPTCAAATDKGCVVSYRSFLQGEKGPSEERLEGSSAICANPASPDDPQGKATLAALVMGATDAMIDAPDGTPTQGVVIWEDAFEAECTVTDGRTGLGLQWVRGDDPPINLDQILLTSDGGTHVLDVNLGVADIVEDIRRRTAGVP